MKNPALILPLILLPLASVQIAEWERAIESIFYTDAVNSKRSGEKWVLTSQVSTTSTINEIVELRSLND
jgi:hypothetical protein